MAAAQENRGRLMQHYKYLTDYPSEDEYISKSGCESANKSPLSNYKRTARESDKKIVGVRVEFSNFEYTINKRKDDIQTETRKLFQDSQDLMALAKTGNTTTDMAKTKRDSNRKRLGELHAEMNTLSRLQREEKTRIEQLLTELHSEKEEKLAVARRTRTSAPASLIK